MAHTGQSKIGNSSIFSSSIPRSASRPSSVFSSSCAFISGCAATIARKSRYIGLSSSSRPSTVGANAICTPRPNKFHHNCHTRSRFLGRHCSTANPCCRSASAALPTAAAVSAVTGVTPSSSKYLTRNRRICSALFRRIGTGAEAGSPISGPAITSIRIAMSLIVRAIGPTTPSCANGPAETG